LSVIVTEALAPTLAEAVPAIIATPGGAGSGGIGVVPGGGMVTVEPGVTPGAGVPPELDGVPPPAPGVTPAPGVPPVLGSPPGVWSPEPGVGIGIGRAARGAAGTRRTRRGGAGRAVGLRLVVIAVAGGAKQGDRAGDGECGQGRAKVEAGMGGGPPRREW
jgi:hypothetical protein